MLNDRFETSETLPKYFKEVNGLANFMTKDEERSLADRIQKGDAVALDRLVTANLKYVIALANKFIGLGLPVDDLIQFGNLGLIEAAHRFTSDKDTKFLTYAKFWIKKKINLALCDYGRTVRLPVNQEYSIYKSKMKGESFNLSNVRIDNKLGEDGDGTIGDLVLHTDFNDPFEGQDERLKLARILGTLTDTEHRIVSLFYGINEDEPLSTKEVADVVGTTAKKVNVTLKAARFKMRKEATRCK